MAIYLFRLYVLTLKYRQSTRRIGWCFKVPGLVRRTTCSRMDRSRPRKSCGKEFAACLQRSGNGWISNLFLNFVWVLSLNEGFIYIIQVRDQMDSDGVKPFDNWIPQTDLPVESLPCSTGDFSNNTYINTNNAGRNEFSVFSISCLYFILYSGTLFLGYL